MLLLKPSKGRNTSGVPTTTTGLVCGPCIIQRTARQVKRPQARRPKPTLPRSTQWTAIPTWNDKRARVEFFLGSGWPL